MGESVISTIGLLVNGIIVADSSADTTNQNIEFKLEATTKVKFSVARINWGII